MRLTLFAGILFLSLFLVACGGGKEEPEVVLYDTDLRSYGVPFKIKTPSETPDMKKDEFLGELVGLSILDKNYYVQIMVNQAPMKDLASLKAEALGDVKKLTDEQFLNIVQEDENGFIYEKKFENDTIKYYDFRFVKTQGEKLYTMSTTTTRKPPHITEPLGKEKVFMIYKSIGGDPKEPKK